MLTPIAPPDFDVDIDLLYATPDNLTRVPIYRHPHCLLHPDAAAALRAAIRLARGIGCRLRLYDAFRPVEAQWALWRALPDPSYIADPSGGSTHSRGIAVDLTLADGSGRPLDMGTGFDDMTEQSHHGRTDLTTEQQRNRAALLGVMTAAGWRHYSFEWWHYQLPDEQRYPLLTDAALGGLMMG
ncbi:D-alanyl-D-alanine dipeptidase [Azospirillum brasilense]|uniref:D-alanyl-D-alanine dipeptidase n=1 Tax=Azospirillum brasilense TaxID=192 RepID=UPI000E6A7C33|nr:D-alanyl-D-alanine dipeptidase [Azospirillum brasilense]NUB26405.1 D-alanyl-D-alanine dipeptidase [Azospirillum brasilense]NUB34453.1 D-alanyl-D-alanine dipeptidase [Azospirillum brasilense]RIV98490.1 D-alanyl-D-alanine dipeptidase [Azospirillum brasilense]